MHQRSAFSFICIRMWITINKDKLRNQPSTEEEIYAGSLLSIMVKSGLAPLSCLCRGGCYIHDISSKNLFQGRFVLRWHLKVSSLMRLIQIFNQSNIPCSYKSLRIIYTSSGRLYIYRRNSEMLFPLWFADFKRRKLSLSLFRGIAKLLRLCFCVQIFRNLTLWWSFWRRI